MRSCLVIPLLFAALNLAPAETLPKLGKEAPAFTVSSEFAHQPLLPRPVTLRETLRDSALIFSGTVLKVEHVPTDPNRALPITRIRLRVENAIRGARPGQVIEIREWAGLWNAGERYRVGEHVLLFLYPASKLGLTSPVGGTAGRFRVENGGTVQIGRSPSLRTLSPDQRSRLRVKDLAARIRRAERE